MLQLKGALHQQKVEVFSDGGDGVLCYQGRLERYQVDFEVASDNDHALGDCDCEIDTPSDVEYDEERVQLFMKQRNNIVSDKLENYKELEKVMSFGTIEKARKTMNYYAIACKQRLKIEKTDPSRASVPHGFNETNFREGNEAA
ncbi:hypothetical protein MTR67_026080 [Solanum verrucosum]|uniref:Uncharacterized protein n=1 Tax=Solanum verrucosum TaxID=315347 RepID=A0AAF0TZ24_SOLVR|nr:hypothetical protein MTR67_026080 [Solanum verrucosum]